VKSKTINKMKKVHYKDLVIGKVYYFDTDFEDFGTFVKKGIKSVSFNNSNTIRYWLFNDEVGFATHDDQYFYEKENQ
jgi:hypothetical protein